MAVEADERADEVGEGLQQEQCPYHADDVDGEVGEGGTAGRRVGFQRHDVGSDGSTDVLAKHEHDALVDMEHSGEAERHRDGHDGCRRLHAECKHQTHEQEKEGVPEVGLAELLEELVDGGTRLGVVYQRGAGIPEGAQSEEEECHAEEEVAYDAAVLHVCQYYAEEEGRINEVVDVEHVGERHNPGGDGGADMRAHNYADGLHESEQSGVDERHGHQRGGGGTLHGSGDEDTGKHAGEAVGGHCTEDMAQLWSDHLLQTITHGFHTKHEECQRAEQLKNYPNRHK